MVASVVSLEPGWVTAASAIGWHLRLADGRVHRRLETSGTLRLRKWAPPIPTATEVTRLANALARRDVWCLLALDGHEPTGSLRLR